MADTRSNSEFRGSTADVAKIGAKALDQIKRDFGHLRQVTLFCRLTLVSFPASRCVSTASLSPSRRLTLSTPAGDADGEPGEQVRLSASQPD